MGRSPPPDGTPGRTPGGRPGAGKASRATPRDRRPRAGGSDGAGDGTTGDSKKRFNRFGLFGPGWWASLTAGGLSAAGWVLSFPPVSGWLAVLLSAWPMIWIAERAAGRGWAAWRTGVWVAVGTLPAWAWLTRWSALGSPMGFPILVAYLALFMGITVWAMIRCRRAWPSVPMLVVGPVVWVAVEFLRGRFAFDGFPWFLLAHPLVDAGFDAGSGAVGGTVGGAGSLAWPAAFVGTYAVSGLAVFAVAWIETVRRGPKSVRRWLYGLVVIAWAAGAGLFGLSSPDPDPDHGPFRVGVVQTNLPQSVRGGWSNWERLEDWRRWRELLAEAARGDPEGSPDVVLFPETMFPGRVLQPGAAAEERSLGMNWIVGDDAPDDYEPVPAWLVREDLLRIQGELGVPVLIGAPRYEGFRYVEVENGYYPDFDRNFNSVFLIEGGEVDPVAYDKQHLTPFGEIMPYISEWPWLEDQLLNIAARGMSFDLAEGRTKRVFELESMGGRVGCVTPICFEATIPPVCRELVFESGERRADVMVNVTNDGWFYEADGGRELHMLAARWRCVELATPMVRAANTGISSAIDAGGRVTSSLEPYRSGVLIAGVTPGSGVTVYGRFGDVPALVCLLGAILAVAASYTRAGRRGQAGAGPGGNRTKPAPDDDKSQGAGEPAEG